MAKLGKRCRLLARRRRLFTKRIWSSLVITLLNGGISGMSVQLIQLAYKCETQKKTDISEIFPLHLYCTYHKPCCNNES